VVTPYVYSSGGCCLNVLVLSGYSIEKFGNRTDRERVALSDPVQTSSLRCGVWHCVVWKKVSSILKELTFSIFCTEYEESWFLQSVSTSVANYMVSHARRLILIQLRESQIWGIICHGCRYQHCRCYLKSSLFCILVAECVVFSCIHSLTPLHLLEFNFKYPQMS
jgi:hypothetical protein